MGRFDVIQEDYGKEIATCFCRSIEVGYTSHQVGLHWYRKQDPWTYLFNYDSFLAIYLSLPCLRTPGLANFVILAFFSDVHSWLVIGERQLQEIQTLNSL